MRWGLKIITDHERDYEEEKSSSSYEQIGENEDEDRIIEWKGEQEGVYAVRGALGKNKKMCGSWKYSSRKNPM